MLDRMAGQASARGLRERMERMALGFYITGKGFTQDKYDTTTRQLEEAGAGAPDGRVSHVALETAARFKSSTSGSRRKRLRRSGKLSSRS
jgi:hypothetical protein